MKKIFLFVFIISVVHLYAVDFKTKEKSELYVSSGIDRIYSEDISGGEKVQEDGTTLFYGICDWNYAVRIMYRYGNYFADLENLIPYQESCFFSNEVLTSEIKKMNKKWISKTYFDLLSKNSRESIKTIQSIGYNNYENSRTEFDENYLSKISTVETQKIFNVLIKINDFFNSCNLYIEKIEEIENGYKIETKVADWYMYDSARQYREGDSLSLKLISDGDFIFLKFMDDSELESFTLVNDETFNEIKLFMKKGNYDKSHITWPRHADGTCDYDNSKISAKTPTATSSAAPSTPTTNVSVKKLMTTNCNLKLRAAEATSSNVLTVMAQGTKVKILELGIAETIDGISSNWVKVEVQKGAKDRDGKPIAPRTTGWCYGGYLE